MRKGKFLVIGILAMVLVFGIWFTACDTGSDEKYDPIVYTSKDASGNTYKLVITKNTSKAAFTPASGDNYTLTITYTNGTTKTSTGTVASYSSTAITFVGATSFTVTITSSGTMTKIEGTISLEDNTTVPAPGTLTPQGSNPGETEPTPPAANSFVNTTWKCEQIGSPFGSEDIDDKRPTVVTLSFGTNTWSIVETSEGKQTLSGGGTYTVSGNTATLSGDLSITATINGNTLTFGGLSMTKVN